MKCLNSISFPQTCEKAKYKTTCILFNIRKKGSSNQKQNWDNCNHGMLRNSDILAQNDHFVRSNHPNDTISLKFQFFYKAVPLPLGIHFIKTVLH